jgi:hypothetical protein
MFFNRRENVWNCVRCFAPDQLAFSPMRQKGSSYLTFLPHCFLLSLFDDAFSTVLKHGVRWEEDSENNVETNCSGQF